VSVLDREQEAEVEDDADPLLIATTPAGKHGNLYRFELGWTPVPTRPGTKHPAITWKEFQRRKPTDAEMIWWNQEYWDGDNSGIAIVTGVSSGITVIDIDSPAAEEWLLNLTDLPETATVTTRRGKHLYFDSTGLQVCSVRALGGQHGLDVRSNGGVIVAPPTPFVDGSGRYSWETDPRLALAPLPHKIVDAVCSHGSAARSERVNVQAFLRPVLEGARNATLMQFGGTLLAAGASEEETAQMMHVWNQEFAKPPLSRREVEATIKSLLQRHHAGGTTRAAFDVREARLLARMHRNGLSVRELAHFTGRGKSTVQRAITHASRASRRSTIGRGQRNKRKGRRDKGGAPSRCPISKRTRSGR
jgi:hypothetical protein